MAEKKRSGGPRTEAGKARSSQNARKHGLLTEKIFILQTEDPAEWQKLQDAWIAKLQPKDDIELVAVNRIAFAVWRIHRLWAMETAAVDKEMDDQGVTFNARYGEDGDPFLRQLLAFEALAAKEKGAGLMHRYQGHLERCYTRAFKAFMDLRTKTELLNELEESQLAEEAATEQQPQVQPVPEQAADPAAIHADEVAPQQPQNQADMKPQNAENTKLPNELRSPVADPATNAYTDHRGAKSEPEPAPGTLSQHGSTPPSPDAPDESSTRR